MNTYWWQCKELEEIFNALYTLWHAIIDIEDEDALTSYSFLPLPAES